MKNIITKSYLYVIAMVLFAFSSCTDEYSYSPAQVLSNAQASLEAEETSYYYEGAVEQQEFSFKVNRPSEEGSATVALISDNAKVKVPESVTFNAGEKSKTVTAKCSLEKGDKITVSLSVADADANLYSKTQFIVITLERDKYAWVACGKASVEDNLFTGGPYTGEVEIQRCESEGVENTYKLVNPFFGIYEEGSGDVKFELDATGNPKDVMTDDGFLAITANEYELYYLPEAYSTYCYFTKDESGVYTIGYLLVIGGRATSAATLKFSWKEGYPY